MTTAENESRQPVVHQAAWTFDLTGDCVYCKKKCTRAKTFCAVTQAAAEAHAAAAMTGLCHRKCGGY